MLNKKRTLWTGILVTLLGVLFVIATDLDWGLHVTSTGLLLWWLGACVEN